MNTPAAADQARAWSYDELLREGVSLIPAYAPGWTNHNPSDPGITLVELLAYISEILAYRALRITPDAKLHFLHLLEGSEGSGAKALFGGPAADIDDAIRARVQALAQARCAVTAQDFETLAAEEARQFMGGRAVVRAMCMPGTDLRSALGAADPARASAAPADVSVIVAPEQELDGDELQRLCGQVQHFLAEKCLMTTRVHVLGPVYLHVFIGCRIAPQPGVSLEDAIKAIDTTLRRRFGPVLPDEPLAEARPFGRPLQVAEIIEAIDRTQGIDYVEEVSVWRMNTGGGNDDDVESRVGLRIGKVARPGIDARLGGAASVGMRRILRDASGELESVQLHPWELVRVRLAHEAVQVARQGGQRGD